MPDVIHDTSRYATNKVFAPASSGQTHSISSTQRHRLVVTRKVVSDAKAAEKEVDLSIDRLIYYAGWADKYQQVFSAVNPIVTAAKRLREPCRNSQPITSNGSSPETVLTGQRMPKTPT